ncbi:LacI family DNA-binding transcriptional regulator [uncultured Kordia sp.]|uniref:LacI family DNA-binding transcriptional regulator n=1 Tax=uncultured Kordia sp. TaxID=507699 RepID=UPI002609CE22|nr:LacI family DNA-binding transcriptional regulator [uncultured Kordia sp.]
MKPKITLKSLAEILNVSVSTVSKSLANNPEISDETRLRVRAVATKYNYIPNQYAVRLRKGNTKTIGVIIPNILNPFFAKVLIGLEEVLSKKGYNIITSISHESTEKEIKCVKTMSLGFIDGLIMCLAKETQINKEFSHLDMIIDKELPMVLFDRIHNDIECDKVINDDYEASYRATTHLIQDKGCKNIALVSSIADVHLGKLRLEGYQQALIDHGIEVNPSHIINSPNLIDFTSRIPSALKDQSIDGFFGVNESAIMKTINIAKKMEYDISTLVPIAAFCNTYQLRNHPSLIIVDQHATEIGHKTAQLMLDRLLKDEQKSYTTATVKASLDYKTY